MCSCGLLRREDTAETGLQCHTPCNHGNERSKTVAIPSRFDCMKCIVLFRTGSDEKLEGKPGFRD